MEKFEVGDRVVTYKGIGTVISKSYNRTLPAQCYVMLDNGEQGFFFTFNLTHLEEAHKC